MLGLGRALGETIAVDAHHLADLRPATLAHILRPGGNSIASLIALRFAESNDFGDQRADGRRPRAVRDDAGRQRGRLDRSWPVPAPARRRRSDVTADADRHERPRDDAGSSDRSDASSGSASAGFGTADALELVGAAFASFCARLARLRAAHAASRRARVLRRAGTSLFLAIVLVRRARTARRRSRATTSSARVVIGSVAVGLLVPLVAHRRRTWSSRGYHALAAALLHPGPEPRRPARPRRPTGGGVGTRSSARSSRSASPRSISVPLGVATAVFLNEIGGRLARPVRMFVDAMSASRRSSPACSSTPCSSCGLGQRYTGFAAALALVGPDAADRHPHLRGGPAPRSRRPARGVARARRTEWRDDAARRAADRARRPRHRRDPRRRARRRRDRAAARSPPAATRRSTPTRSRGQQDALPLFIYKQIRSPQPTARSTGRGPARSCCSCSCSCCSSSPASSAVAAPGTSAGSAACRLARKGLA